MMAVIEFKYPTSFDPWTSIGFDGVREKAWERGLTVTVAVTRGDGDMEKSALTVLELIKVWEEKA